MEYRTLGNTGIAVSTPPLDTMCISGKTPEEEAFALLDAFMEAGQRRISCQGEVTPRSDVADVPPLHRQDPAGAGRSVA